MKQFVTYAAATVQVLQLAKSDHRGGQCNVCRQVLQSSPLQGCGFRCRSRRVPGLVDAWLLFPGMVYPGFWVCAFFVVPPRLQRLQQLWLLLLLLLLKNSMRQCVSARSNLFEENLRLVYSKSASNS